MRVVAYLRVSTDQQVRRGFGLDAQRAEIRSWAKANGHRVVQWCSDEGISGANGIDLREGLYDALAAIKARKADALVITSLDRLARQMTQQEGVLAQVWKAGGKVFSIGDGGEVLEDDPDDPIRTAVRQMRGVFAELERGLIRQRMTKGKNAKRSKGGYTGGAPPFGFDSDHRGNLIPNAVMQTAVERIKALHAEGSSLRQVIARLDAEGLRPRRGGIWHPATVARSLRALNRDGGPRWSSHFARARSRTRAGVVGLRLRSGPMTVESSREFADSLERAVSAWKKWEHEPWKLKEAQRALEQMIEHRGPPSVGASVRGSSGITPFYLPKQSRQYVSVTWRGEMGLQLQKGFMQATVQLSPEWRLTDRVAPPGQRGKWYVRTFPDHLALARTSGRSSSRHVACSAGCRPGEVHPVGSRCPECDDFIVAS